MTYPTLNRRLLFISCAIVFLQACTTISDKNCRDDADCQNDNSRPSNQQTLTLGISTHQPEVVIATDLINALVQVPNYSGKDIVLKLPNSNSTYMSAIQDVLIKRGIRVERSQQRTGRGVLMLSAVKESRNSTHFTYFLAIDRLAMKRTYHIKDKIVAPVSSLYIRGISPSLISLNDGLFIE